VFTNPIFDILPIPLIAVSILLMLLVHTVSAFVLGGLLISVVCFALYHRLNELGTEPDVLTGVKPVKHGM